MSRTPTQEQQHTYTLHRLKTSSTLSPSCQDETTNLLFRISTCLSDESTSKHCLKTSPSMIRFRSFQLVPNPNSNSLSSLSSSLSQDSTSIPSCSTKCYETCTILTGDTSCLGREGKSDGKDSETRSSVVCTTTSRRNQDSTCVSRFSIRPTYVSLLMSTM